MNLANAFAGAGQGQGAAAATGPLVSFKAGKMELKELPGGKFKVTPETRKGQVSISRTPGDQLLRFEWKDRHTSAVVDDVTVIPSDMEFKKVDTGKPNDRVYVLQIKNSSRRFLYWMQERSSEKDAEVVALVNQCLGDNPPATAPSAGANALRAVGQRGGATDGATGGQVNIQDLQSILQNMGFSAEQQRQGTQAAAATPASGAASTAAGAGASGATSTSDAPATTSAAAAPSASRGLTAEDLQRAMMNIAAGSSSGQQRQPPLSLASVVNADDIVASGVLQDADVVSALAPLLATLPADAAGAGAGSEAELQETLRSPQLRQALGSLSAALQSDNFNSIMSGFGLDANNEASMSALTRGDGVEALLQALLHAARQQQGGAGGSNNNNNNSSSGSGSSS